MPSSTIVVLITGANSGVGYAATKAIADASPNYHVIMACRNPEKGEKAMQEIKASGIEGELSLLQLDIIDQRSVAAATKHVQSQFGRLDVLVNNAGIGAQTGSLKDQLETTFRTNVVGPAMLTEAMEPLLLQSRKPYVLNISSGLGSLGRATDIEADDYHFPYTPYRASKAALNMITVEAWKKLGKQGVKVFAVSPGFVRSNLRGTTEEQISGGGFAGPAEVSGQTILSIVEGKRDADNGRFVHKDGLYPW